MRITRGSTTAIISKVTWSSDGAHLFAGGEYEIRPTEDAWKRPLVTFDPDGKRFGVPLPLGDNTIESFNPAATGSRSRPADPAFGLVDGNGQINPWKTGVSPEMRGKLGDAFTIASNAKQVRFGLGDGAEDPVLFDLGQSTVTSAPDAGARLCMHAVIEGLADQQLAEQFQSDIGGQADSRSTIMKCRVRLPFAPIRKVSCSESEFWLRAFDAEGRQLWERAGPAAAWGVNISDDGRIIVAAYRDGTIRWQRWSDGAELLALFVNRKTKAWVAWTPSGYYKASPGGEDLIGWHVNRGWNEAADFFPASKFRDKYARADIVDRVLDTLDEGEAIRQANLARPHKGRRRRRQSSRICRRFCRSCRRPTTPTWTRRI